MIKILAISGSLRKESYNTKVLKNAIKLAPQGVEIELFDIGNLPLYNGDLEANLPQEVIAFKQAIEASDGILFSSPEYNYSISGVLKNALDWGSRPSGQSSWKGKVAGLMGATNGLFGTSRMQDDGRKALFSVDLLTVPSEVRFAEIKKKLDENGNLVDEKAKEKITELLTTMTDWINRFK